MDIEPDAIPEEVFHFTTREVALEKILFEKRIRFGQIGFTNDPRETKDWSFPVLYDAPLDFEITRRIIENYDNELRTIIKQEWKVFCTSQNPSNFADKENANPFERSGYCRPRMWAHYGQNHLGICLKFNGKKLTKKLIVELGDECQLFFGPVRYNDIESIVAFMLDHNEVSRFEIKEGLRKQLSKNYQLFFLAKSKDWETEQEYRWLIHSREDAPIYLSIENIIDEVMVGADFPKVYESTLVALCQELKIPAGRVEWQNGMPAVNSGSIYKPNSSQ